MPTNLPPECVEAEKRYREAQTPRERAERLETYLSLIPKHKGTDRLRADLRHALSKLKDENQASRKKHASHAAAYQIEKEGAGQVVLLGATNTGKSSLLRAFTHAEPQISPAPFTTWNPDPGMMLVQNIQVQLVDTPALDRDFLEAGLFDLVRHADLLVLVVDLQADPLKQVDDGLAVLAAHHIVPLDQQALYDEEDRMIFKPLVVLVNKVDDEAKDEDFALLCDLFEGECPLMPISAESGRFFDDFKQRIFDKLDVIRVFARPPGKEPDLERPFVLKNGSTINDLARKIHKDFYEHLKSARVWGSSMFDGQPVQRDYLLHDGDIVELKA
jgi:hypothetical protein